MSKYVMSQKYLIGTYNEFTLHVKILLLFLK